MMSVIISVCLAADPKGCELRDLGPMDVPGFKACRLSIEPRVIAWQLAHPDLIVQSAYCMPMRDQPAQ